MSGKQAGHEQIFGLNNCYQNMTIFTHACIWCLPLFA